MTSFGTFLAESRRRKVASVQEILWLDTETPVSIYLKLRDIAPRSFLFESVEGGRSLGRYSIIGVDPAAFVSIRDGKPRGEVLRDEALFFRDIFAKRMSAPEFLQTIVSSVSSVPDPEKPRFTGGWVGYFGYDSVRMVEDIPLPGAATDDDLSDVDLALYTDVVVVDNVERSVTIISNALVGQEPLDERRVRGLFDSSVRRVNNLRERVHAPLVDERLPSSVARDVTTLTDQKTFEGWVGRAKEYIVGGDIFQVVLSRRELHRSDRAPFEVYRSLRRINPSPYMYFINSGESAVIGSSPEMLLRVDHGVVQTRPIAGTRRRAETAEKEKKIEEELLADPKEKAEHLMLVDLSRNDIGRICEPGTVHVPEFMLIEKFSHVMHLCSTVVGKLRADVSPIDALYACFPAGTLTGAPKIRAMQIISELEPNRRGIYGGAVGYVDFSGNLDTCIAIRTIVARGGEFLLQAGAGIVHDSVPSREFAETVDKMGALVDAMEQGEGGRRPG